MSGDQFVQFREENWYPEINYDYITTTDYGGGNSISQHLVEQLIQAHKDKREIQLRLAEKELKEALNLQGSKPESKKAPKNRLKSGKPEPEISFPRGLVHEVSVIDESLQFPKFTHNSSEILSQDSFSSSIFHSSKAGVLSSPRLDFAQGYGTWNGRSSRSRPRIPYLNARPFHDSCDQMSANDANDSPSDVDISSKSYDFTMSKNGKISQSEGNILSIGSGNINSGANKSDSNESQMSVSDSLQQTRKSRSFKSKIWRRISTFAKRKPDRNSTSSNTSGTCSNLGVVISGPTNSFKKQPISDKEYPVDIYKYSELTKESTPQKIIKISDQVSSGGLSRPTNLDLAAHNRSPNSQQGKSIKPSQVMLHENISSLCNSSFVEDESNPRESYARFRCRIIFSIVIQHVCKNRDFFSDSIFIDFYFFRTYLSNRISGSMHAVNALISVAIFFSGKVLNLFTLKFDFPFAV